MAVAAQPQTELEEQLIEDSELEAQLETRETAKQKAGRARKTYKEIDEAVRVRVNELDVGEVPARCGRFVISRREVAGRSVAFDTDPTTRLTIRADKDAQLTVV
jgi:hypothetical protein